MESKHKYIQIVTDTENLQTLMTISSFEELLVGKPFYRCHRSFIVNLNYVDKVSGNEALLGDYNIPISRPTKAEFIDKLGKIL